MRIECATRHEPPAKTLYSGEDFRIDVENPAPGKRPGKIEVQFGGKGSPGYNYDLTSGSFTGLSKTATRKLLEDPNVQRAIAKGLKYLGQTP